MNNDHLSTTASILESQGWPLYTGLTVYRSQHPTKNDLQQVILREIGGREGGRVGGQESKAVKQKYRFTDRV